MAKLVPVHECSSISIRKEAERQGLESITRIVRVEHPDHPGNSDWAITLWKAEGGPWWVIETNGDPVFESEQPAFDDILNEYGITIEGEPITAT